MKIGILTFHHSNYNYGAVLQAFSIYKLIESLGYESYIINYTPEPQTIRKKMAAWIVALLGLEFRKFRKKNIPRILHKTNSFEDLKKLNNMLDGFIVGSDQVWRYRSDTQSMRRYYLDFAGEKKLKIAYAASFGTDNWEGEENISQQIKQLLQRFDAISVREKSGINICQSVFGIKTTAVLDPTLLLNPAYFHEMADRKPMLKQKSSRMAYMLLDDSKTREKIFREVAKRNKLKFVRIHGIKLLSKKGFFLFKSVNFWLSNIKNAEIVVTDSFHCVAFSILFQKKFICLANAHRGVTRIENLLKLLGLQSRLISDLNHIDEKVLKTEIDYKHVEDILLAEKNKSLEFLRESLSKMGKH
ncbi:MAG: polysaccharide pyruvyl transferase family protein [Mariniphaga sp.]|nr:polysaccharide pyruvyl transferase family protein [Mariniphaga sp.]MDD4424485.1 polysaccharide pyruvyl transferase family protein [Mariniphaga sp.]